MMLTCDQWQNHFVTNVFLFFCKTIQKNIQNENSKVENEKAFQKYIFVVIFAVFSQLSCSLLFHGLGLATKHVKD